MEMNQKLFDDCTQQFRAEKNKYAPNTVFPHLMIDTYVVHYFSLKSVAGILHWVTKTSEVTGCVAPCSTERRWSLKNVKRLGSRSRISPNQIRRWAAFLKNFPPVSVSILIKYRPERTVSVRKWCFFYPWRKERKRLGLSIEDLTEMHFFCLFAKSKDDSKVKKCPRISQPSVRKEKEEV